MKIKLLIISLLICTAGFSQKIDFKRKMAESYYKNFDFHKAIPLYEELLKISPADITLYWRLATIYDHLNDSQSGEKYYAYLANSKDARAEYLLNYARILAKNGKYDQSVIWYQKYSKAQTSDTRGAAFAEAYKDMAAFYRDSAGVRLTKAPFSGPSDDFSPAYYHGSIIFSSDRQRFSIVRSTYNWTQSPYLDLYIAKPNDKEAKPFSKQLNTPYHEGPVTFSKTQDTIIFTRSIYYDSRLHKGKEGINRLGLFQARWDEKLNKWIDVTPLPLNNVEYSVEHPALSPDGQKLYFASDMPGGYGGMDLYVSHRTLDGKGLQSWSAAENMGPRINSSGHDLFPFVDGQGDIWFASDGIPGLGGLDILFAAKSMDGFSGPINPGYPVNTRFDDFGYITDSNGENGYLSSDRDNAPGNDDIYSIHRPFRKHLLQAIDARTLQPLSGVKINVLEEGTALAPMESNAARPVLLPVNPLKDYQFAATKDLYKPGRLELTKEEIRGMDTVKILMNPVSISVKVKGFVYTAQGKAPLSNCTVNLQNETSGMGMKLLTDDQGYFNKQLLLSSDYKISITKLTLTGKCSMAELALSTKGIEKDTVINLSIPVYCEGDVITLEKIYYDLDKYNIRPDAALILDKLLKIMQDYPGMKIELRSHTDSRASAAYNMTLSNNRAKAAAEYLYSKGISRNRIVGKGYGETMLINKCADGVPCSEAEHQLNRRTEFKILSLEGNIVEDKNVSVKKNPQEIAVTPPAPDKQTLAAQQAAADKQAALAAQQAADKQALAAQQAAAKQAAADKQAALAAQQAADKQALAAQQAAAKQAAADKQAALAAQQAAAKQAAADKQAALAAQQAADKQALAAQQAAAKQAAADQQGALAAQQAADKQALAAQQAAASKTSQPATPAKKMKYVKIDKDGKYILLQDPATQEFFVQIGAVKKKEMAEKLAKAYQNIIPDEAGIYFDDGFFKVRYGPFKSSSEYAKYVDILVQNKRH
ncbi:MAG: OmpA family protein [Prolixibacteraceae bacterium]